MVDNNNEMDVITLTDEDGSPVDFEYIGTVTLDGNEYFALVPLADNDEGAYIILRAEPAEDGEEGDLNLVTIDDDEEYDRVADLVEDTFLSEIDYDDLSGNE